MELIYCWLICIFITHIILYIYWRTNTEEGNLFSDMYKYYMGEDALSIYVFIMLIWTPLNFAVLLISIVFILVKTLSNIRIR